MFFFITWLRLYAIHFASCSFCGIVGCHGHGFFLQAEHCCQGKLLPRKLPNAWVQACGAQALHVLTWLAHAQHGHTY